MIKSGFLSACTFLCWLLLACNGSQVTLESTTAMDEVQPLANLVFRFSKPMVKDSLLNQWDSSEYLIFKPAIQGRFRWDKNDELIFSPSMPLAPATNYTVDWGDDLFRISGFNSIGKNNPLAFHTPSLALENMLVTWVSSVGIPQQAFPQVDLFFNYPVSAALLKEKIQVELKGRNAEWELLTVSDESKMSLKIKGLELKDKDEEGNLTLLKGLLPLNGSNSLKENLKQTLVIPSPYKLSINDVQAEHDGSNGVIHVSTSQQLVEAGISSFIKLEAASSANVNFQVRMTESGFDLEGAFDASQAYTLTIREGLKGVVGGRLQEDFQQNLSFGELEPSIRFTSSKAVYLSGTGSRQIEVNITSLPKVRVVVSKVYENNLLAALRYGYDPASNEYYGGESNVEVQWGDVLWDKVVETSSLPRKGNSRLFTFNPEDKLPDFKGIYHISIRSTEDYWVSDSRFISLTDIGLLLRQSKDKLVVFANSLQTAASMDGVALAAYGANNQLLATATTNADGVAELSSARKDYAGFKPALIIAKTGKDFNYLPLASTLVNTSRFDVGGKQNNSAGWDAFLYPERDIYRPGESLRFSAIVRDSRWNNPGEVPMLLKLLLPNGKEFRQIRKSLNEEGSLEGVFEIPVSALTGSYTLELYSTSEVLLSSRTIQVEEFVPDRIKVAASLDKKILQPGDKATLAVEASNFYGPPAAGNNYQLEVQVKRKELKSQQFPDYDFSLSSNAVQFDNQQEEGVTDANGHASIKYEVPSALAGQGLLQASFYATVFDENQRPVSRLAEATISTQSAYFGLGFDGYWYYPLNQLVKIPLAAVDANGKAIAAKASVQWILHEYHTALTRDGDYFRYQSQEQEKLVSQQDLQVLGAGSFASFIPKVPGNYEIRVSISGSSTYVSRHFYSYGGGYDVGNSFEVENDGNIDIELDKSVYAPGETLRALFKTPFSGRLLVTVETDRLLSYRYVEVKDRAVSVDLKIGAEHLPNAYVSATLIKPHEASNIPLTVAHGYQRIRVEESRRKLPVQIIAAASSRSKTKQRVVVKASPGSLITLAAVDNGILQVTDFKSPDPYAHFYANRALEMNAYDLYPLLFPELKKRLSSTGGDGEVNMNKRTNPMPAKRFKLLSYWSGITRVGSNGEAVLEIELPSFSGELRLMAVGYKGASFGSQTATMKVADPLVISMGLPRFLAPGDQFQLPVSFTNTTAATVDVDASLQLQGPLAISGKDKGRLKLQPGEEASLQFNVQASDALGLGKFKLKVSSNAGAYEENAEISIRPSNPLLQLSGSGSVEGGASKSLVIGADGMIPGSVDYSISVGQHPGIELGRQWNYLLHYPYGCTEQVVSMAFPQLYYDDLSELKGKSKIETPAGNHVLEAIRKVKLRQLSNGAVTLWDEGGEAHWWATAYAAHFLVEASKAGYQVEQPLLDGLLNYLNFRLRKNESIDYYYNRNQHRKITPKEVAYSLYVLALAGRANVPVMNQFKASVNSLSLDARYLLSVSFALAGDKKRFRELLPIAFSGESSQPQSGGSFYSEVRDESLALNALLDVDQGNAQIPVMAGHLKLLLKANPWFTTQESSFALLALGKMARAAKNLPVTAILYGGNRKVSEVSGMSKRFGKEQLQSPQIKLETRGAGRVYYTWQAEGIPLGGKIKEEDNYIKVRRRLFNRNGVPLNANSFKQNDLVIVQVSLENNYSTPVDNIVISDLLPAGFEIENPRIREVAGMNWVKDASDPEAMDIRDDRINLFMNLRQTKQVYYYAVRAVAAGNFNWGALGAEAMYLGEYHSYNGATRINIVK